MVIHKKKIMIKKMLFLKVSSSQLLTFKKDITKDITKIVVAKLVVPVLTQTI